jgi:tetratricopeptide (TPR) repeat protein
MPQDFRIFLSAVSSEFGRARDAVAADLRARGLTVRVQSDFRQEAGSDTTLRRDHDYIRDCDAVVCIVGRRSGFVPPPAAAAPFADMLPDGIATASYTQWEFFAARHYGKRLSIYIAGDGYAPDRALQDDDYDDPGVQQAFCDYIVKEQDLNRDYFSSLDELARKVLKEDWPDLHPAKTISLPYPSLCSLFKGRNAFLRDLHASLTRGPGRTAITGSALYGLGGIGKTRAAVEYAWAHEADYTALLFVIAETPEALHRNLAALAGPLVLNLPQQHAAEEDVRLKAVLDWLKLHPGWLLILDGVDTEAAVDEAGTVLLGKLTGGRILITSRLANFAAQIHPLELDVLAIEDAVAFLLERTDTRRHKTPDDTEAARLIAIDLGGLALALEQAGAYVAKHQISFACYRELWRENWDKVAHWSDERLTNYPRAVAVTWQTSVNQLTPAGRRLLERLAWFAPEPVPDFLLDVPVPGIEGEDLDDAFASLADYSLARRNPDKREFSIHRLVQEVTRRGLAEQERRISLTEALMWIDVAFKGDPEDVRNWSYLDPLIPHVSTIIARGNDAQILRPTARLMNDLAALLQFKARYIEAETLGQQALKIFRGSCGPNDPLVARALNNLAEFLRAMNRLNEAEQLHRQALTIFEADYGPDHPDVAMSLTNLASLLHATNRLSEAETLHRRALAILETKGHPDHPDFAKCLNNLGGLLLEVNQLGEAEALYRRALAIGEANYGPAHPIVATRLTNLAALLLLTSRINEAEALYRRALAIDLASYGPDHPTVATGLNNLAGLLCDTNRLREAEPFLRRALAIDVTAYGPDHPKIATRLNNLAELLRRANRLGEAEPLFLRALAIHEASYGPEHPTVATDLNNVALLLKGTNRLNEAERACRRALAISEASYGADHPDVANRLNNLGALLWDAKKPSEAILMYQRALVILIRFTYVTGHRHPQLGLVLDNYVRALSDLGSTKTQIDSALASIRDSAREPPS